jgi:lysophospholipase L1-like esterase
MSDFFLKFDIPKTEFSINHFHKLTFLGSCFSDEISTFALQSGFDVLSNPFGTTYNSISIARNILDALDENKSIPFLKRDELVYSWNASTKISAKSELELEQKITARNKELVSQLSHPGYLFITFGTAFIYKLKSKNKYVANCHKQPANLFEKEMSSVDEIQELWQEVITKLGEKNPLLKIIFTVSPVRHVRDGIIENNRSKARLIQAVENLSTIENVGYFPSYEIMMDELRDYRFFKEDHVHPSAEALKYLWKRFSDLYFDDQSEKVIEEFSKIRKRLAHRTDRSLDLDSNTLKSMALLKNKYPWVSWNVEKQ